MIFIFNILIVLAAFFFMEFVAWFTHKFIMHNLLWYLHKDHHVNEGGVLERNDWFFVFFATPGIILLILGISQQHNYLFYLGLGISLYGFAYFLVHDVVIHQRIKLFRNLKSPYFMALRRAHKIHHKHLGKENGENFGMLIVPFKYYIEARKSIDNNLFNK